MEDVHFKGLAALEKLGDLTQLIYDVAEKTGLDSSEKRKIDEMLMEMAEALKDNNTPRARNLVKNLLVDILGYEPDRAEFIIDNHLNKNAGWY